jgi:OOP family OmpA-OmpF porin
MTAYPDVAVEIRGYTDSSGSDALNLRLSQERADAVKTYLVERGVDASRLVAKGYGEADPIANNDTPEGRTQNRRVEMHRLN